MIEMIGLVLGLRSSAYKMGQTYRMNQGELMSAPMFLQVVSAFMPSLLVRINTWYAQTRRCLAGFESECKCPPYDNRAMAHGPQLGEHEEFRGKSR